MKKKRGIHVSLGFVALVLIVAMPCHADWEFWFSEESTGVSLPFHIEGGDSWCGSEAYGSGSRTADSTGVTVSLYTWSEMWVNLQTSSSDSENPAALYTSIWGKSYYKNFGDANYITYQTTIEASGCVAVGGMAYDWYCFDNNDINVSSVAKAEADISNTGDTSDNYAWADGWADSCVRDVGVARYGVEGNVSGENGVDYDGGSYYAYTDFSIDFTPEPYDFWGNGVREVGADVWTVVDVSASAWCDDPNDIVAVYGCGAYAEIDADVDVDVTLNQEP